MLWRGQGVWAAGWHTAGVVSAGSLSPGPCARRERAHALACTVGLCMRARACEQRVLGAACVGVLGAFGCT